MSITVEELENFYRKLGLLGVRYAEQINAMATGLVKVYEKIAESGYIEKIEKLQKVLNDPESQINQAMQKWVDVLAKIDYEKIGKAGISLLEFAEKIEKINLTNEIQFPEVDYDKLFENDLYNQKFAEAYNVAYETARQEAGEPNVDKEELENAVKEELKTNSLEDINIENDKFKETFIKVLKCLWMYLILPLLVSTIYDVGKIVVGNIIKSSTEENSATVYEINNQNTYVNIIEQTENHYYIFFIDEDGDFVNGYIEKENVDLNLEDEEEQ